ncbi:uroporphyrin-III C-methyltransferase/precorrin-2 dehydrogenase/sirohydrochlorin ferrochelatase [Amycolatopsis bartoniae]|uniref:Uroporphyrinogen-III C-methyltransferase n=1 Tax=Amycolatopsis bartoniae TaxID=941986 RepID=A0A8H9IUX6_9PSEU|nr:uroporphyrinogen-III C-methyltransferase [Amycolatopsis bartoniae]MBB2936904.1 uroporphyrin-III C-methyltransferase/precorrin-2 dehydrogenase/sirohydrochlorin ferrochelatase [Amycolatopsis bartoniae]TVT07273.1 uroporphyrinogen-III C-methyltransferase [Amycolatopsis bartoniae]GHF51072.1 uroporphyrinogen-III C-methyltransferase [Amycolatopsis bartoniae]
MSEDHYLVGLDLAGRRVVLVGGGTVAQRRLPRLIGAGAAVELISPHTTAAVGAMADAGEVVWHRRRYTDGDLEGAWYALACTDDPQVNAAVCAEAERRRVFCVRADAGTEGTAVTAASGRHEGLVVGVLSGGEPLRSAAVRDNIVAALDSGLIADTVPRRDGELPGVALVGGGPGDPELITVKGRRLLARADVVVADRLGPRELLDELRPDVEIVDAAKIPYGRAASQDFINQTLIEHAKAGRFVVRLKGGDPYVFGRGFEELLACAEAGVPVTVVPGITSAFSVPAIAGVPVTHRGVAHEVVVVSGHVPPGHEASLTDWDALGRMRGTIVLMMGVDKLDRFAGALLAAGRPGDTPVAIVENGTMPTQRITRSTLDTVAADAEAAGVRPPAVTVIGPVAGLSQNS